MLVICGGAGVGNIFGRCRAAIFFGGGVGKILWVGVVKHFRRCCDEMYFGVGWQKINGVGWQKNDEGGVAKNLWSVVAKYFGGVVKSYDDQGVAGGSEK